MSKPSLKKFWDEIPKSIAVILATIVGSTTTALLSLVLGEELKAKIAHGIFVSFSAIEQILKIIPRLIYLLTSIAFLSISLSLWMKLKKERKPKDKLTTRYEYGYQEEIIVFYPNPNLYSNLTPLEIANDMEAKAYCQKCNTEIIAVNNEIKCNCTNIHRAKGHIAEAKEFARCKLLEFLRTAIPK